MKKDLKEKVGNEKKAYYPNLKSNKKIKLLNKKIIILKSTSILEISTCIPIKGLEVTK